jgi:hypothetical protein
MEEEQLELKEIEEEEQWGLKEGEDLNEFEEE